MSVEFDRQKLELALQSGRNGENSLFSLHIFDHLASTNQTLWNLLAQGAESWSVVIAQQQTAGRGQWGRQWISHPGGLYLSVAIAPKLEASASYQLTLASAWGIANQLRCYGVDVGIKWPNDLVLNGRKLGGILTETKINHGYIHQAVIGVGINWTNPVPETGINLEMWQACYATKPISCLETLTSVVLRGIESGMECLVKEGINILLSRYLELLTNVGDKVYIHDLAGTVVGVTSQGELRVSVETYDTTDIKTTELYIEPGTITLGYRKSSVPL
ncbi:biotin--[acetyl-CoA-carboxylase] ligase [Nostoc sp. FACHB-87]|uniref:biotin--[acetyl-CoA-carboxylase] ligase n=1 Tax=Nostocales TaxID=1161 RepID=UPI001683C343|nr:MULTISPECIES: biotin--[acetyl-CoA-carboxylase] ligase [Nostocales]MBD2455795.1 biotin--[acetyl-CoA-carboxylase] ligase [Nostoc sp. FACHB-87]MBD2477138.1 biotin--[acetyl-CoA-carboxylase] ligase [Anabaena sp. FACHB-83]MBD2486047.1 biotin--[acetyl-CoA-carboxylase] ligase [Aulosira sp. FACHB-615]